MNEKLLNLMLEIIKDKDNKNECDDKTHPYIGKYVIVRSYSEGVHAGILEKKEGTEVFLKDSRRLWKWSGAFTLSELSVSGTKDPGNCKFSCLLPSINILNCCSIIPCTDIARNSIEGVKEWKI